MQQNILHIANYYIGAKVYKNLVETIDQNGVNQTIYTAFSGKHLVGANAPDLTVQGSKIIYRPILNTLTRLNYLHKVKKIITDIRTEIPAPHFDCIHAHTLFSDGRIACMLSKQFGIPYIVTIRNTDLNFFFRYFIHLRKMALNTLRSARKIIFISEAYRRRLLAHPYFAKYKSELSEKCIVIPNGVDQFWLSNVAETSVQKPHTPARLLFAGKISKGKNLLTLIDAVIQLNTGEDKCVLDIAGGGTGSYFESAKKLFEQHPDWLKYHGAITDKQKLLSLYRASDLFVMPSKKETFGLVYVEALSQGLPVIYTQNEGIDGFFPPETGLSVNCRSSADIASAIQKILRHYAAYRFVPAEITAPFNWRNVADQYLALYSEAAGDNAVSVQSRSINTR